VTASTHGRAPTWTGWQRWSGWAEHAAGDTLLHADIRADNLLITSRDPVVIDWPWACRGAAFVDPVLFAPSVAMQGAPRLPT